MNKLINRSKGPALEYSEYAMSFFEGCVEEACSYCYMKSMSNRFKTYFGPARLKPWLINEENAIIVFLKEMHKNLPELQKKGLFFNFSSDPGLEQAFELNETAWMFCILNLIPVKILTKQTEWVEDFLRRPFWEGNKLITIGFTLTGHDELETGAATNQERIKAMRKLNHAGFKTWASIEPVIFLSDINEIIDFTHGICDFYKIGLLSGKKFDKKDLETVIQTVIWNTTKPCYVKKPVPIYFKDSLLKQAGINREDLPSNCVNRNFNL
jgi:DNA repair photolyase